MRILIICALFIVSACTEYKSTSVALTPEQQQQQDLMRQQNLLNAFALYSGYQQQQVNSMNAQVYHPPSMNCRTQNINGFGYMNCY